MASYEPYDREYSRRHVREERRDDRDRYLDPHYGRPTSTRELVPRGREDSELSIEEIRRDFPPPSGRDVRRARSAGPYDDDYYNDYPRSRRGGSGSSSYVHEEERRYKSKKSSMTKQERIIAAVAGAALLAGGKELYDRREAKQDGTDINRNALSSVALAGVGALAAYQGAEFYNKQQAKKDQKATYILHRGRDGHISEYYSDDDEDPRQKKGHKNFLESALAATGLGAAVKTLTGGKDDDKSDTRSRRGSGSRDRGSSSGANKIQKAAMASLLAGATEAFRVSKEPGGWKGEKAKRILTVAAGAATVDAAQDRDHGKLGMAEAVIGGLVGNRLIRGSKSDIEEDGKTGRSRSRSRARSQNGGGGGGTGLAALATAGLGAFGAKKAIDSHRSRSRGRRDDSYDSRSPSPDRRRSRSRSVVDKARNGLAKLGIGGGLLAAGGDDDRRRTQDDFDDRASTSRRSRRYSDDAYDDPRSRRGQREYDDYDDTRSQRSRRDDRRGGGRDYDSDSSLGDSSEDEKKHRKMRGKQIITTSLASIATIHAAHEVYQSMEKRQARHKAVRDGCLSPTRAKQLKNKALLQDAASVGIAALGIKGAIDELKEVKEISHECQEFKKQRDHRHERREEMRRQSKSIGGPQIPDSWGAMRSRSQSRHVSDGFDSGYDDYDHDPWGPRYIDDNPYCSTTRPPPPMDDRFRR